MGRTYAGILGLIAFLVVLARGVIHHASVTATVWQALVAMFVFAGLGLLFGQAAAQTVADTLRAQFLAESERLRAPDTDRAES